MPRKKKGNQVKQSAILNRDPFVSANDIYWADRSRRDTGIDAKMDPRQQQFNIPYNQDYRQSPSRVAGWSSQSATQRPPYYDNPIAARFAPERDLSAYPTYTGELNSSGGSIPPGKRLDSLLSPTNSQHVEGNRGDVFDRQPVAARREDAPYLGGGGSRDFDAPPKSSWRDIVKSEAEAQRPLAAGGDPYGEQYRNLEYLEQQRRRLLEEKERILRNEPPLESFGYSLQRQPSPVQGEWPVGEPPMGNEPYYQQQQNRMAVESGSRKRMASHQLNPYAFEELPVYPVKMRHLEPGLMQSQVKPMFPEMMGPNMPMFPSGPEHVETVPYSEGLNRKLKKLLKVPYTKSVWIATRTGDSSRNAAYYYNPITLKISYDRPPPAIATIVPQTAVMEALDTIHPTTLVIRPYHPEVGEIAIRNYFKQFGDVAFIRTVTTRKNKRKPTVFFRMGDMKSQAKVIELRQHVICDKKCFVSFVQNRLFVARLPEAASHTEVFRFFNNQLHEFARDCYVADCYRTVPYKQFAVLIFSGNVGSKPKPVELFSNRADFSFNGISITCARMPPLPEYHKPKVDNKELLKASSDANDSKADASAFKKEDAVKTKDAIPEDDTDEIIELETEKIPPSVRYKEPLKEEDIPVLFNKTIAELSEQGEMSKVRSLQAIAEEVKFVMAMNLRTVERILSGPNTPKIMPTVHEILEQMNAEFTKCGDDKLRTYLSVQKYVLMLCQEMNYTKKGRFRQRKGNQNKATIPASSGTVPASLGTPSVPASTNTASSTDATSALAPSGTATLPAPIPSGTANFLQNLFATDNQNADTVASPNVADTTAAPEPQLPIVNSGVQAAEIQASNSSSAEKGLVTAEEEGKNDVDKDIVAL